MSTIERRRISVTQDTPVRLEERAGEDSGLPKITGYSAVFEVDTEIQTFFGNFQERIQKGAFRRAIREGQNVRALRNHNPDNLLGTTEAKTLKLREDDTGLFIEIDTPNTSIGKDTMESVKRGDLSGMSFAFVVRKEKWINGEDGATDLRIIQDVDLYDVGPVTYPAYAQTTADIRSQSQVYQVGLTELGKEVPRLTTEQVPASEEKSEEISGLTAETNAPEPEPTAEVPSFNSGDLRKQLNKVRADLLILESE